jgi:hypothetical protein
MRLRCISRYRSAKMSVEIGAILDVSEAEAQALQADAPGCWADAERAADETEQHEPETAALDAPPADKMVKGAPKTK